MVTRKLVAYSEHHCTCYERSDLSNKRAGSIYSISKPLGNTFTLTYAAVPRFNARPGDDLVTNLTIVVRRPLSAVEDSIIEVRCAQYRAHDHGY